MTDCFEVIGFMIVWGQSLGGEVNTIYVYIYKFTNLQTYKCIQDPAKCCEPFLCSYYVSNLTINQCVISSYKSQHWESQWVNRCLHAKDQHLLCGSSLGKIHRFCQHWREDIEEVKYEHCRGERFACCSMSVNNIQTSPQWLVNRYLLQLYTFSSSSSHGLFLENLFQGTFLLGTITCKGSSGHYGKQGNQNPP